jgi:hypothetical protein
VLAAGAAFAAAVMFYLGTTTGVRARRWPLAMLAGGLGFVWVGVKDPGYVAVSGGVTFVAVVVLTRDEALRPRRSIRWTAPRVGVAVAGGLVLAAVSVSYGALHPLALNTTSMSGPNIVLRHGVSRPVPLLLENRGPLAARVVGIRVDGAPAPAIRRAVVSHEGPLCACPTSRAPSPASGCGAAAAPRSSS